MKRSERKHLADLRNRVELADLEVLSRTPAEVLDIDPADLTVGQMLVIGDFISTVTAFTEYKRRQTTTDRIRDILGAATPSAASAERRSDPFGLLNGDDAPVVQRANPYPSYMGETVETPNGPVKVEDIPRDEDGIILNSWVDDNCMCPAHVNERKQKARYDSLSATSAGDGDRPFGQYV